MQNEVSPPENGTAKSGLQSSPASQAKMSWPSLILGLSIMGILSVYPVAFADRFGNVNHKALMILMWSMMAGIIRGVGFVPKNRVLKMLFSTTAAFVAFIAAIGANFLI